MQVAQKSFDLQDLPHRFGPPPGPAAAVGRQSLLRALTEASLLRQLLLVRAPAGAGKTVLLGQWAALLAQMQRPALWLSLEAADADPESLLAALADAFDHRGHAAIATAVRGGIDQFDERPLSRIAQQIAAAFNRSDARPIIILDNYDPADSPANAELIDGLLRHAPGLPIALASRSRPRIATGDLRARDRLLEIGPEDIAFTAAETHQAFSGSVPELYTRRLHAETSGSAVAITFARRAMDEVGRPARGSASWHEALDDYYHSELLERFDDDLRAAVSRLVIVERFDTSLALALAGPPGPRAIARLYRDEGMLLRDRYSQQYHFPERLRRFLETRLDPISEEERIALHGRAAGWFADRSLFMEAAQHAIQARDPERADRYFAQGSGSRFVAREGVPLSRLLLEGMDDYVEQGSPHTHLSLAIVSAHEGKIAIAGSELEKVRHAIRTQLATDPGAESLEVDLLLVDSFVSGFRDEPLGQDRVNALDHFLDHAPLSDHDGRAQARIIRSWHAFDEGHVEAAERLSIEAGMDYAGAEGIYGSLFSHIHRVLAQYWLNDLDGAATESMLIERMVHLFFPADQRMSLVGRAFSASMRFEQAQPDPNVDILDIVGMVGALESWIEIQLIVHRYAVRAVMASGRFGEAHAILANGREVAARLGTPRLDWNMRLMRVELLAAEGDLVRAQAAAVDLGILESGPIDGGDVRLTWQERFAARSVAARLLMDLGDLDPAEAMLDEIAAALETLPIPRVRTMLEIARARLAVLRGNGAVAEEHLAAARATCRSGIPVRLFLEGGEELRPYLGALDGWEAPTRGLLPGHVVAESPMLGINDPLTAREREILHFMGEGHPNKIAAHRLGLSEATVKFHLRNIYRKLSAQNRTQALARYRSLTGGHGLLG